jgi:hypothetical protein
MAERLRKRQRGSMCDGTEMRRLNPTKQGFNTAEDMYISGIELKVCVNG